MGRGGNGSWDQRVAAAKKVSFAPEPSRTWQCVGPGGCRFRNRDFDSSATCHKCHLSWDFSKRPHVAAKATASQPIGSPPAWVRTVAATKGGGKGFPPLQPSKPPGGSTPATQASSSRPYMSDDDMDLDGDMHGNPPEDDDHLEPPTREEDIKAARLQAKQRWHLHKQASEWDNPDQSILETLFDHATDADRRVSDLLQDKRLSEPDDIQLVKQLSYVAGLTSKRDRCQADLDASNKKLAALTAHIEEVTTNRDATDDKIELADIQTVQIRERIAANAGPAPQGAPPSQDQALQDALALISKTYLSQEQADWLLQCSSRHAFQTREPVHPAAHAVGTGDITSNGTANAEASAATGTETPTARLPTTIRRAGNTTPPAEGSDFSPEGDADQAATAARNQRQRTA
jgi:hypothetical protein